jgi:flagellar hook-basal body complex protein FliE
MNPVSPTALLQLRSTVLSQNAALQRAAGSPDAPVEAGGFSDAMLDAVKTVNAQQGQASEMSAAYERGDTNDIVGVMLARQKASLEFEATLQVRNKLLGAYRDIMNMPV